MKGFYTNTSYFTCSRELSFQFLNYLFIIVIKKILQMFPTSPHSISMHVLVDNTFL